MPKSSSGSKPGSFRLVMPMPKFSLMSVREAFNEAQTSSMPDELAEYAEYLRNLPTGQAGRLVPSDGEGIRIVRLRLSAAARRLNRKIVIRRTGDELVFWENTQS